MDESKVEPNVDSEDVEFEDNVDAEDVGPDFLEAKESLYPEADFIEFTLCDNKNNVKMTSSSKPWHHNPVKDSFNWCVRMQMKEKDDEFVSMLHQDSLLREVLEDVLQDEEKDDLWHMDLLGDMNNKYKQTYSLLIQNAMQNRIKFAVRQAIDICELIMNHRVPRDHMKQLYKSCMQELDTSLCIVHKWQGDYEMTPAIQEAMETQERLKATVGVWHDDGMDVGHAYVNAPAFRSPELEHLKSLRINDYERQQEFE